MSQPWAAVLCTAPIASIITARCLRKRVLEEANNEACVLAQREATASAEADRLRLEEAAERYEYEKAKAARIVEENRQIELNNERMRLETEANRQATVERELALEKQKEANQLREIEVASSQAALLQEKNEQVRLAQGSVEADKQRKHELELERQRAATAEKELETAKKQEETVRLENEKVQTEAVLAAAAEQRRKACEQEAGKVKRAINLTAISTLLRGKKLGVHVDSCFTGNLKLVGEKTWMLSTMTELLVDLDVLFAVTAGWNLDDEMRRPTMQEFIRDLASNTNYRYQELKTSLLKADLNLVVVGHNHSEFARWEMALVVGNQTVLMEASEVTKKPESEAELTIILGGLLIEMFACLGPHSHSRHSNSQPVPAEVGSK